VGDRVKHHVVIIGCGPAGAAAAIQLRREGIDYSLFADSVGGCVRNAGLIENLPGYPGGVCGETLVACIQEHLLNHQIEVMPAHVTAIEADGVNWAIKILNATIHATHIIVATGTKPRLLGVPGEEQAHQAGRVLYDIDDCRNAAGGRKIIIVGGGDVAYDYALQLQPICPQVTLVQRSETPRCVQVLKQRVAARPDIEILSSRQIIAVACVEKNVILSTSDAETITGDLALVAVGRQANRDLLAPEWQTNPRPANLFIVGDAAHPHQRQVALAFGDGMNAAIEIAAQIHSLG
jgi:thioredoxin reductase (NADPH)